MINRIKVKNFLDIKELKLYYAIKIGATLNNFNLYMKEGRGVE